MPHISHRFFSTGGKSNIEKRVSFCLISCHVCSLIRHKSKYMYANVCHAKSTIVCIGMDFFPFFPSLLLEWMKCGNGKDGNDDTDSLSMLWVFDGLFLISLCVYERFFSLDFANIDHKGFSCPLQLTLYPISTFSPSFRYYLVIVAVILWFYDCIG